MENSTNIARQYDNIGATYAGYVDTSVYNSLYERPAMLAFLPDVNGRDVLDAGCGSGWYATTLVERGARVVACDASPVMATLAQERIGTRGHVHVADLSQPLSFLDDESVDIVIASLVMHYLKDWTVPLTEFARVLRPGGTFVFSTHHPGTEAELFDVTRYFETELLEDTWDSVGQVRFYRRPLSAITNAVVDAGLAIERIAEPIPSKAIREADSAAYERLLRRPAFLLLRAKKETRP